MPELSTIYDYMRAHAALLGERILQQYPALHQFDDSISPRIDDLLRRPFPAQTIAIMGVTKRWGQARTSMVVAECGTGKPSLAASVGAQPAISEEKKRINQLKTGWNLAHLTSRCMGGSPISARAATCSVASRREMNVCRNITQLRIARKMTPPTGV